MVKNKRRKQRQKRMITHRGTRKKKKNNTYKYHRRQIGNGWLDEAFLKGIKWAGRQLYRHIQWQNADNRKKKQQKRVQPRPRVMYQPDDGPYIHI